MRAIAEFPSADGVIRMEVTSDGGTGRMSASDQVGRVVQTMAESFEAAFQPVRTAAKAVVDQFSAPFISADEIEVEFGIKFNSKVGFYVASADAEASLKVRLTWRTPNGGN